MLSRLFPGKQKTNQSIQETRRIKNRSIAFGFFLVFLITTGSTGLDPLSLLRNISNLSGLDWMTIGYWTAVLLFVFAIIYQYKLLRYAIKLDREGVSTPAVIKNRRIDHGSYYMNFILSYTYLTDQQADANVPGKAYHQARKGDTVLAYYLADQPNISRLDLSSIPERKHDPTAGRPTPMGGE